MSLKSVFLIIQFQSRVALLLEYNTDSSQTAKILMRSCYSCSSPVQSERTDMNVGTQCTHILQYKVGKIAIYLGVVLLVESTLPIDLTTTPTSLPLLLLHSFPFLSFLLPLVILWYNLTYLVVCRSCVSLNDRSWLCHFLYCASVYPKKPAQMLVVTAVVGLLWEKTISKLKSEWYIHSYLVIPCLLLGWKR